MRSRQVFAEGSRSEVLADYLFSRLRDGHTREASRAIMASICIAH